MFTFRDDLVDHPMLRQGMEQVEDFITRPRVPGLAPLVNWDRTRSSFVYPIGSGALLSGLMGLDGHNQSTPTTVRAALELLASLGRLLDSACQVARTAGLTCHGALNPWRIVVHPTQSLTVVGYGLPSVEVATWLDEETDKPPGPALRFFPPERIEDDNEDVRSDVYAAGVCAAEMILGQPLLTGRPTEVVDAILDGQAPRRLADAPIPAEVRALLIRAVARDPKERIGTGSLLAEQASALLPHHTEGQGLYDLARERSLPSPIPIDDADEEVTQTFSTVDPGDPTPHAPLEEPAEEPYHPLSTFEDDDDSPTLIMEAPREVTAAQAPPSTFQAKPMPRPEPSAPEPPAPPPAPAIVPRPTEGPRSEDLPPSASLEELKAFGKAVALRCAQLSEQATTAADRVVRRTEAGTIDLRIVRLATQSADRARAAAESAKRAADLLALDEDASAARISLDLVRNAEGQCEQAADEAEAQVAAMTEQLPADLPTRPSRATTAPTSRRAAQHADSATDAANSADDLVTALEEEQARGCLGARGCAGAFEQALAAAEQAHREAERSRSYADQAERAGAPDDVARHTQAAAEAEQNAHDGLTACRDAADRARRLEAQARTASVAEAQDASASAQLALEEARSAHARAQELVAGVPTSVSVATDRALVTSGDGLQACEMATRLATQAADEASRERGARAAGERAAVARAALAKATSDLQSVIDATDDIARLAGGEAEAAASVARLTQEAETLLGTAQLAVTRCREEVEDLHQQTAPLKGDVVLQQRAMAMKASEAAQTSIPDMVRLVRSIKVTLNAETIQRRMPELRDAATKVADQVEAARVAVGRAWDSAEGELARIRKKELDEIAIAEAAVKAREHAAAARALVDDAWTVARAPAEDLKRSGHEEAMRLRNRALEILDNAEFQATEAAAAAEAAGAEKEPSEARAQAQTALLFLERVTTEVPEAIEAMRRSEELASQVLATFAQALDQAAEAAAIVQETIIATTSAIRDAKERSKDWAHLTRVDTHVARAEGLLRDFEEDKSETDWALSRAADLHDVDMAVDVIDTAHTVIGRVQERGAAIDEVLTSLLEVVAAERAAAAAVQEAKATVTHATQAVAEDLQRVRDAQERLLETVAAHAAGGPEVTTAQHDMSEAVTSLEAAVASLQELDAQVQQLDDVESAQALAAQASMHRTEAERTVEAAAETEGAGVAAAEREAMERAEEERRRLDAAKERSRTAMERMDRTVADLDATLAEAEPVAAGSPFEPARLKFHEAARQAEAQRSRTREAQTIAAQVEAADGPSVAEARSEAVRTLVDDIVRVVGDVQAEVTDALDQARAAAAEAEALAQVRAEITSIEKRSDEAVNTARKEAQRIIEILRGAPSDDVRALGDEAARAIQAASKAAAKVKAASPMAAHADSLRTAQNILDTSRQALAQANEAAESVNQLVHRATRRMQELQEEASRALDDARQAALEPASLAAVATTKAEGWLEAGQREVRDAAAEETAGEALRDLERSVEVVTGHNRRVRRLAEEAGNAPDLQAANAAVVAVREASDLTVRTSADARRALDRVRHRVREAQEANDQRADVVADAAQSAANAAQLAEKAEATLRQMQRSVRKLDPKPPAIQDALDRVAEAARAARFAAARADQASQRADEATIDAAAVAAGQGARAALREAMEAMDTASAASRALRATIEQAKAQEAARRDAVEDERRRNELARRALDSKARAEERQAELAARRKRDQERRERFARRRSERSDPGRPVLRGVEDPQQRTKLRAMLEGSRAPGEANASASLYASRESGPATVAEWNPSRQTSGDEHRTGRRRPSRPRTGDEELPAPTLERLRASRTQEDEEDADNLSRLLERLRAKRDRG